MTLEAAKDTDIAQIFLMDLTHVLRTVDNTERPMVGGRIKQFARGGEANGGDSMANVTSGNWSEVQSVRSYDISNQNPQRFRVYKDPTTIICHLLQVPLPFYALSLALL